MLMRTLLMTLALAILAPAAFSQTAAPPATPSPSTTTPAAKVDDKDLTPDNAGNAAGTASNPIAIIQTTEGVFRCVLFKDEAPLTVDNFVGLATGTKDWTDPATGFKKHHVPLYTATIFHRVIPNFMIQGGDPEGTGEGDPGYKFKDEFRDDLLFDRPGRLAMANSGPNTNGSQFFITEVPTPHLNGKHTIFGQCDNVNLVQQIAREPRDPRDDRPITPVSIVKISFEGLPKPAAAVHKTTTPVKSGTTAKPKATPQ
jgi:cyclophilin family peptidyl-prolyl cis-trans isomerase